MNELNIDIPKSIKHRELCFNRSIVNKILENFLIPLSLIFFLYVTSVYFYDDIIRGQSYKISLPIFLLIITICILYLITLTKTYSLDKIIGISEIQNSRLVKEIVSENNWDIQSSNNQLDILEIPFTKTLNRHNKQIIVIYNGNDILINCVSFTRQKEPNPFKYYSNRKVTKEFKKLFAKKNK